MNLILLFALSGFLAVADSQCYDIDITSKTGIISSPPFIKKQRRSCNWIFEFNHLKPQMLILNLTDVQLYYLVWDSRTWRNIKTCGASLKIGEENLDCKAATPKCYAFYNKHNDCLCNKDLESEYKGCYTIVESGNINITSIYDGSYGAFHNFTIHSKVENHPRGFHMTSKVLNCNEETTATTDSTTRQDTSPVTTTPVSTIYLNTTTAKTTSDSATLSSTSDILSTDSSSRAENATSENNQDNPSSKLDGTIIIIVACSACLLLLVTVIIAVFFVRKRKQAQIPATTPGVTYENVGAPRQNLQSEKGVIGASGQNLPTGGNRRSYIWKHLTRTERKNRQ